MRSVLKPTTDRPTSLPGVPPPMALDAP